MLFRSGLAEQIGLLDESFGSGNYEDDDYCLRAELAGFRNLVAGDVFIHHAGGATFDGNLIDRGGKNRQNRAVFKQKWEPSRLEESVLRKWLVLNAVEEADKAAQRSDRDRAVSILLNQGIKADSSSPLPYFKLAEVLMSDQRHADALQVLPEMPLAADRLLVQEIEAICHAALGDDEAALLAANHAQARPGAQVVLGTLAARQGDLDAAQAHFRRAVAADPSCGSGWLALGMLLWGQGKLEDAWSAVKRSVSVAPHNDESITILQDMAKRQDLCTASNSHLNAALQIIAESAHLYPDSRILAQTRAGLLAECGHEARALEACEAFLVGFGLDDTLLTLALALRTQSGIYDRLAEAGTESVSLCMIVKNEQKNLARCLASLKPAVHEMVVVDTGSSDRTGDIATIFGARLFPFPWSNDFSAARNYGIEMARGAWILVMDADEVIAACDHALIHKAVTSSRTGKMAWSVMTRNYTTKVHAQGWIANDGAYPAEETADGWHPSWKVRLFPAAAAIRFDGEIHEMVEKSLKAARYTIKKADFVIHHYGGLEADEQQAAEKRRRYFDIGMQKLQNNPDDMNALTELAVQAGELGDFEDAIMLWDRVLAQTPDNIEALFNKGYALMGLRRYAEALGVSKKVLGLTTGHKEAAFNFATCSLYAGDPQDAIVVAEKFLTVYPDYPPLYAVLTALYLASGKTDQAVLAVIRLRELKYAISDYIRDRAAMLERLGRETLAQRLRQGMIHVEDALSQSPHAVHPCE